MGAVTFINHASGATAEAAFDSAVQQAQWDHGHAGYSGTIAEKNSFVLIDLPEEYRQRPEDYAEKLISDDDPRVDDKWGPAGCLDLGNGQFIFFGWASS